MGQFEGSRKGVTDHVWTLVEIAGLLELAHETPKRDVSHDRCNVALAYWTRCP